MPDYITATNTNGTKSFLNYIDLYSPRTRGSNKIKYEDKKNKKVVMNSMPS
jgi:hypothetical protein